MMQAIKDRNGHLLGHLDEKALSNAIVAQNRLGHIVAIFDVPSNTTRLPNGHVVAEGNTLAAFLVPDR